LTGGYTEAHILEQRLNEYGWQKDQSFVWIRVPGTSTEAGSNTALPAHNLYARIKELLPDSCAFEYSGGAAVLINLEYIGKESRLLLSQSKSAVTTRKKALLGKRETAVLEKKPVWEKKGGYGNKMILVADILDAFLEQEELKAGFGDVFTGATAFREYYKQAELALRLGMRRNPQGRMFYFRDAKELLLLDNCLKELPATMVCAPEVLALKNYDHKHNTIYYETLYSYLRNNLRPVQTIKDLNIHRSTLIYRLEKIQKITGMDMVNCDNQWYLLLSYKLLEHADRYGGT
jgi:sugar diacid utilization regulator